MDCISYHLLGGIAVFVMLLLLLPAYVYVKVCQVMFQPGRGWGCQQIAVTHYILSFANGFIRFRCIHSALCSCECHDMSVQQVQAMMDAYGKGVLLLSPGFAWFPLFVWIAVI